MCGTRVFIDSSNVFQYILYLINMYLNLKKFHLGTTTRKFVWTFHKKKRGKECKKEQSDVCSYRSGWGTTVPRTLSKVPFLNTDGVMGTIGKEVIDCTFVHTFRGIRFSLHRVTGSRHRLGLGVQGRGVKVLRSKKFTTVICQK